jgi:hypothetical protein
MKAFVHQRAEKNTEAAMTHAGRLNIEHPSLSNGGVSQSGS